MFAFGGIEVQSFGHLWCDAPLGTSRRFVNVLVVRFLFRRHDAEAPHPSMNRCHTASEFFRDLSLCADCVSCSQPHPVIDTRIECATIWISVIRRVIAETDWCSCTP